MSATVCIVDDCDGLVFAREWCRKHYARWQRHGDPLKTLSRMDMTPAERILSLVDKTSTDCWLWTGLLNDSGYGTAKVGQRKNVLVHRWMYEYLLGPIPDGLQLDHLCRVRACCKPAHLEPVTNRENWLRGEHPTAVVIRTNVCARGHDFAIYGYERKDRPGARQCGECNRLRLKARREAAS